MIANFFRLLRILPQLLATTTGVVAIVEAVGSAAVATGPQKRAAAIARLRSEVEDLALPLPDRLVGVIVDGVVWALNTLVPNWGEPAQEAAAEVATLRVQADGVPETAETRRQYMARLKAEARAEFERLEKGDDEGSDDGAEG